MKDIYYLRKVWYNKQNTKEQMMKERLLCAVLLAVAFVAGAGERVYLWPEGKIPDAQPHQIAAMTDEANASGFKADEHRAPCLDWYAPPKAP